MSKFEKAAVDKVKDEVVKWKSLRAQLDHMDLDAATLSDTLEGETDLFEACLLLSEEIAERDTMEEAVSLRIKELQERKSRISVGTDTLRAIITQAMDRSGIKKIPGDLCTLSLATRKPGLVITDEAQIPAKYFTPQDPKIDKKAIKAAIEDEETIPGAQLGNGGISLTIRRK